MAETGAQTWGQEFSLNQIWSTAEAAVHTEHTLFSTLSQPRERPFKKPLLFPMFFKKIIVPEPLSAPPPRPSPERITCHRRSSQPNDLAAVAYTDPSSDVLDEGHPVTTAATNMEEEPHLFGLQEFSYEASVRKGFEAELEFGEASCLAYCTKCGKETRTVVEREPGWGLNCCVWGRKSSVHRCGRCNIVISRL